MIRILRRAIFGVMPDLTTGETSILLFRSLATDAVYSRHRFLCLLTTLRLLLAFSIIEIGLLLVSFTRATATRGITAALFHIGLQPSSQRDQPVLRIR